MSEADKIFDELGYKKTEWGKTEIQYTLKVDEEGWCIKSIWFNRKLKTIRISGQFTLLELKAISIKIKELRWKY